MLNDAGLQAILTLAAPVIEHLNTASASEKLEGTSLQEFAQRMPCLERLELTHCSGIEPTAFSALVSGVASTLKFLDVTGCRRLGNDAILSLTSCTKLQRLILYGLWRLETPALLRVLEACQDLRALDVSHCRKLKGPELLRGVAAYCTNIRELVTGAFADVQDEDVISLALSTAGSSLECWCLAGSEITDRALAAIRQNCPTLQRLDISDCHDITESGLLSTVVQMTQLRICKTNYCRNVPATMQLMVSHLLAARSLGIEDVSRQKSSATSSRAATCSKAKRSQNCRGNLSLTDMGDASTTTGSSSSSASSSGFPFIASPPISPSVSSSSGLTVVFNCTHGSLGGATPKASSQQRPEMLGARSEVTSSLQQAADSVCQNVRSQQEARLSTPTRGVLSTIASLSVIPTSADRSARVLSQETAKSTSAGSARQQHRQSWTLAKSASMHAGAGALVSRAHANIASAVSSSTEAAAKR
mmetsp:Transcript_138856/g.245091  ORF Transcript_138856/g.245091 Transcript_138856/m.245091 type:complete len:475 (-) Transcript_138856:70-1494(-)